jgi:hypothetical protein
LGIFDHSGGIEARNALEEPFCFMIFIQSVECPLQDVNIDLC